MKNVITSCLVLASLLTSASASASPKTAALVREAEKLDFTPEQMSKLESLCEDYERAAEALNEYRELMGLKMKPQKKTISADVVDPTIRKIQEQARKYHGRFEVLKRTQNKWGPSTNLLARVARQSMQSKLDNERDVAKWTRKLWKAKLKAEKKDQKNYEKWVKDTEKARDKSSDEWKPFFQGQLDQAAAAREEDPQIRDTDM